MKHHYWKHNKVLDELQSFSHGIATIEFKIGLQALLCVWERERERGTLEVIKTRDSFARLQIVKRRNSLLGYNSWTSLTRNYNFFTI